MKPVVAAVCDAQSWDNMENQAQQLVAACTEASKSGPTEATRSALEKAEAHHANVCERAPTYEKLFALDKKRVVWRMPAEHAGGSFFGHGYWSNFAAYLNTIIPELPASKHEDVLQGVLGCAQEDSGFANKVQQGLASLGLKTKVLSTCC